MEKDGLEPGTASFQGNVVYVKLCPGAGETMAQGLDVLAALQRTGL